MIYNTKHICAIFLRCVSTNASSNDQPDWKTFHTAHNCTVLCQCGSPCVWQGSLGGQMLWDTWHMDVFLPFLLLRTWSAFLELLALTVDFKWKTNRSYSHDFPFLLKFSQLVDCGLVSLRFKLCVSSENNTFSFKERQWMMWLGTEDKHMSMTHN